MADEKRFSVYLTSVEIDLLEKIQGKMPVITPVNALIRAGVLALAEKMGVKQPKNKTKVKK